MPPTQHPHPSAVGLVDAFIGFLKDEECGPFTIKKWRYVLNPTYWWCLSWLHARQPTLSLF